MADEFLEATIRIIAKTIEADPSTLGPDTEISEIDVTSLDLADIIFELEDEFNVEIDLDAANAWDKLKTVSDIATEVGRLAKAGQ